MTAPLTRTVADKARVKPGTTIALLHPVGAIVDALGLEAPIITRDPAAAKLVFVFVGSLADLHARLPNAAASLADGSHLWVFFKKGSSSAGHDMNRDDVWAAAQKAQLRPVGLLSVDDTWSAFRFKRG